MYTWWDILGFIAVSACCLLAVTITPLRLPGTWLIVATGFVFAWLKHGLGSGWRLPVILAAAAVVGEIVETVMSAVLARRAGATRPAQWGAIIGGILGMIFLSFLVPIPLVGSMVGALLGCFLGAAVVEFARRKTFEHGARVGVFAVIGFALGTAAKTAIAVMMAALLLNSAWCSGLPASGTGGTV